MGGRPKNSATNKLTGRSMTPDTCPPARSGLVHNHDLVGEGDRFHLVVGDVQTGDAKAAQQALDLGPGLHTQLRIQVRERLIQQRSRARDDGAAIAMRCFSPPESVPIRRGNSSWNPIPIRSECTGCARGSSRRRSYSHGRKKTDCPAHRNLDREHSPGRPCRFRGPWARRPQHPHRRITPDPSNHCSGRRPHAAVSSFRSPRTHDDKDPPVGDAQVHVIERDHASSASSRQILLHAVLLDLKQLIHRFRAGGVIRQAYVSSWILAMIFGFITSGHG